MVANFSVLNNTKKIMLSSNLQLFRRTSFFDDDFQRKRKSYGIANLALQRGRLKILRACVKRLMFYHSSLRCLLLRDT